MATPTFDELLSLRKIVSALLSQLGPEARPDSVITVGKETFTVADVYHAVGVVNDVSAFTTDEAREHLKRELESATGLLAGPHTTKIGEWDRTSHGLQVALKSYVDALRDAEELIIDPE